MTNEYKYRISDAVVAQHRHATCVRLAAALAHGVAHLHAGLSALKPSMHRAGGCVFGALALALLLLPGALHAQELITERAWYEDKTGVLDWASTRREVFVPFDGALTQGVGTTPLWVRLRIDPQAQSDTRRSNPDDTLILRVWPTVLDQVMLFDPLDPQLGPRLAGDRYAWSEAEYPSLSLAFRIPRGNEPRYVWLRIETESTRRVAVDLQTLDVLWMIEVRQQLIFSVYLGLMLLFLSVALVHLLMDPDRLVSAFAWRQSFGLLFGMGYLRIALDGWVPALWSNHIFNALLFLAVLTGVWFEYVFFSELHPPNWARYLIKGTLAVLLGLTLLMLVGFSAALSLLLLALLVLPVLGLVITLQIPSPTPEDQGLRSLLPRALLVAIYAARALLMLASVVPALGLFETTQMPLSSLMLQQILLGSIMVIVLYFRAKRHLHVKMEFDTQLAVAREQVSRERAHREEHHNLLAMLAHELKTPLAAMKILVSLRNKPPNANATLHRMLSDMNQVIERCLQSVRTHEPALALQTQEIDVSQCMRLALARTAEVDRIEVTCPARLSWNTDAQVFQMVVCNLLDNAMKYSPAGSSVQLGVETTDTPMKALRLWVENAEGSAGVPDPDKVFEKYYRNPLASRHSGSGLGLYLARAFVKALGGKVHCATENHRVRFEVWLPN